MPTEPTSSKAEDPIPLVRAAFRNDDAPAMRGLLERFPALQTKINEPIGDFDSPPIVQVRSREMLGVLLAAGAGVKARTRRWAGGFEVPACAEPVLEAL